MTDGEVLARTNEMARIILAEAVGTGYAVPEGYLFYRRLGSSRCRKAWDCAVKIMDEVFKTDVQTAVANEGEDAA